MNTLCVAILSASAVLLTTVGSVAAQKIWLVDSAGGGHFKTLGAAVQAAKNGDTILIQGRSAPYGAVTTSKALAFRGINTPVVQSVTVAGLPKGAVFSMRSLVLDRKTEPPLVLRNNRGAIHCEDVVITGRDLSFWRQACLVSSSSLVTFNACRFDVRHSTSYRFPAMTLEIRSSVVSFSGCVSTGAPAGIWRFGSNRSQPGIWAKDSRIAISGGRFTGGNGARWSSWGGFKFEKASPAIDITGGSLVVEDAGGATLTGGTPSSGDVRAQPTILASKVSITIDPKVILISPKTKTKVQGVTPTMLSLPGLSAFGGQTGAVVQTVRHGAPGVWVGLILGIATPARATPFGDLWLAPTLYVDIGKVGLSGMRKLDLPIPRTGIGFGIRLGLQSFQLQGAKLQLSPPVVVIVN